MHELAIADAIVNAAERHAEGRRVTRIHVRIGHLRQIVPDALRFGFEVASSDTAVAGAELEIERVEARGTCRVCGADTPLGSFPMQCAACGGFDVRVEQGEELVVDWLEVDEVDEGEAAGTRAEEEAR